MLYSLIQISTCQDTLEQKKKLTYLQIKAVWTFPSCPDKYSFTMQNNPAALDQVKMWKWQSNKLEIYNTNFQRKRLGQRPS